MTLAVAVVIPLDVHEDMCVRALLARARVYVFACLTMFTVSTEG